MTKEGRLQRGKENYEFKNLDGTVGKFLENSETIAYAATLKEKSKDVKSNK